MLLTMTIVYVMSISVIVFLCHTNYAI